MPATVSAPAAAGGLAQLLANAVVARTSDSARDRRPVAQPQLSRAPVRLLQRVPEEDMTADPEQFLRTRIVSLDFLEGMRLRAPELQDALARDAFVAALGSFTRHWFRLVPNPARSKEELPAYILTPAIEKYVQASPEHPLLAALIGNKHLPKVEPESSYLRAAYVPYLTKKARDPERDVGHVDVRIERSDEEFTPDFVFTAAMNGCAFTVTGSGTEDSFTAWHYQSPDSNRDHASKFRVDKSPTDWFGSDEYDSGEHTGLYEVTNVLWRPRGDNGWKVLSQEVDVNAKDTTDVQLRAFRSRPLHLKPGAELDYTRRIYAEYARNQLREIERTINANRRRYVIDPEPSTFAALEAAVRRLIAGEIRQFDQARDLEALGAAAGRVKQGRSQIVEVEMLAHTIAKLAHHRVTADLKRWKFRQDRDMQGVLGRRIDDMARVLVLLARTAWLDELAVETLDRDEVEEPPPTFDLEGVKSSGLTIPDLKLIPRPPLGFYVPPQIVALMTRGLIRVGQIFTVNGRDFRVRKNSETGEMALWFALRGG